jgi:serine phosphatase RsbU (regulator of sigma subunit)
LRAVGDATADDHFEHVLRQMVADRLLVTEDDDGLDPRVDLAHEVMITAWPTLAGWIQTRRTDEQRRRQLEVAAAQWMERGRGAGGLLDPIELGEVEAWRRTESARELGEIAEVAELIAASTDARDRQEALQRDLEVARQIQRFLMPAKLPQVDGLEFAVHYEPPYRLGGGFYDFIWHDSSHLGLVIGDVAGKTIRAALYIARLTSELRIRAAITRSPARLLRRVNKELVQLDNDGMFATLVYCIYDLENRSLVFTNAGHHALLRRGDRVFPLQADRAHIPPLGVTSELEAGEARVQLLSDDMLIMMSRGIITARDPFGNDYGLSRLARRIRTARNKVDGVVKAISVAIDCHCGKQGQERNDKTLVAMSIHDHGAKRKLITADPEVDMPDVTIDRDEDDE